MALSTKLTWANSARKLEDFTKKTENFLRPQNDLAEDVKHFVKYFYDSVKSAEELKTRNTLPELIIENFDDEQIWQELELQNNEKFKHFIPQVAKFIALKNKLIFPMQQEESHEENLQSNMASRVENGDNIVTDNTKKKKKKAKAVSNIINNLRNETSIVDDKFFKLREMEEFLLKEENKIDGNEEESDDESIDLFADEPSSDDDEAEDPDDEEGLTYGLCYNDFFDPIKGDKQEKEESDTSSEVDSHADESDYSKEDTEAVIDSKTVNKQMKTVSFADSSSGSESEEESVSDEVENLKEKEAIQSTFEGRQERLKERIDEIHEEALSEKPWQLQGEITATRRPQNSLLEEVLEFDMTSRPPPVITEQTTLKLEDIIKQRIKDKVWDDVERKVKPVDTPTEYKKTLVLDQEKSKLSLAQIYEQEYLKKQKEIEPQADPDDIQTEEDPPEHVEIKNLMHSLFEKLNALSNYHYTPKLPNPEIKVISNVPAITVEEVAPVATSDATLLAPEEIKGKSRGVPLSTEERTTTDKKRARRRKKKKQRNYRLNQEAKEREMQKKNSTEQGKKIMSKTQAAKHVAKAAKEGSVKMLGDAGGSKTGIKSSTAFFTQLQDEVTSLIKKKAAAVKRKKGSESDLNIKRFKL